jgi:hypothetical protein
VKGFQAWLTYKEISMLLLVEPKTIANRVSKHRLQHVLTPRGKCHRKIALVSPSAVRALAALLKTPLTELPEEKPVMRPGLVAGGLDEASV